MADIGGYVGRPTPSVQQGLAGGPGVGYYGGAGSSGSGAGNALLSALGGLGGGSGAPRGDIGTLAVNGVPTQYGMTSGWSGQTGAGATLPKGGAMGATGTMGSTGTLGAALGSTFSGQKVPGLSNTAQTPQDVQWLINQIKGRTQGQAGTGEAIDIAGSKIRDAGAGLSKALAAQQAARGTLGTGAAALQQGKLATELQKQIAGSASDIALQRQKDIDQMLLGSEGIMEAPAKIGQADKSLALQQYLGQAGLDVQKYGIDKGALVQQNAQNAQQQSQLLSLLMNLY